MKELLGKDMRLTNQRRLILEELRSVTTHPTADEVYGMVRQKMPRISLGTVYRNLEYLAHTRAILKLSIGGNMKRFDGCCDKHYHAICLACGRIFDVPAVELPEIASALPEFTVTGASISFEGYCAACRS